MIIVIAIAILVAHVIGHNATEIITDMPVLSEDFDPHPKPLGCCKTV